MINKKNKHKTVKGLTSLQFSPKELFVMICHRNFSFLQVLTMSKDDKE